MSRLHFKEQKTTSVGNNMPTLSVIFITADTVDINLGKLDKDTVTFLNDADFDFN